MIHNLPRATRKRLQHKTRDSRAQTPRAIRHCTPSPRQFLRREPRNLHFTNSHLHNHSNRLHNTFQNVRDVPIKGNRPLQDSQNLMNSPEQNEMGTRGMKLIEVSGNYEALQPPDRGEDAEMPRTMAVARRSIHRDRRLVLPALFPL